MSSIVCVTGASGFLGSHIVSTLLERAHHVIALVRDHASAAASRLRELPLTAGARLEMEQADLVQPDAGHDAIARAEYVIHTAGSVAHEAQPGTAVYRQVLDVNIVGSQNVLDAVEKAPGVKKLIFTSSMAAVLGSRRPGYRFTEADWNPDPLEEGDAYGFAKTCAERTFVQRFADSPRLRSTKLVCINPSIAIGPARSAQHTRTSLQIIEELDRGAYAACPNLFYSFVDVRDVARVHVEALAGDVEGRFLMPGRSTSLLKLARLMKKLFPDTKAPQRGAPDLLVYASVPFNPRLTVRYLRRHLGVEFQFDDGRLRSHFPSCYRPLEDTLVETIRSLREVR